MVFVQWCRGIIYGVVQGFKKVVNEIGLFVYIYGSNLGFDWLNLIYEFGFGVIVVVECIIVNFGNSCRKQRGCYVGVVVDVMIEAGFYVSVVVLMIEVVLLYFFGGVDVEQEVGVVGV